MPFLEQGDVKIHYQAWTEGSGAWITLINGYTRTLTDFKSMGRFLSERGYRVITFDNRGAGKAECPPVFTLEDIAGDIVSLWDHLGADKSHVLGISFGGAIATTLAALQPDRVRSLVIVSSAVSTKHLMRAETVGPSRDPRRLTADLARDFSPQILARNQILVSGFMRQMGKIFQEPDTALGARAQRAAMEDMDLRPRLPNIKAPTLVLHGEMDAIVGMESAEEFESLIPGAQLERFPEVGHLLLAEVPLKLYESAEKFFREH